MIINNNFCKYKISKALSFITIIFFWLSFFWQNNVYADDKIVLTKQQKEKIKNDLFLPIIWVYKKIIVNKQIEDLVKNITISIDVWNKVPVWEEINAIHNYLMSVVPVNNKEQAEKIWNKTNYIRNWVLPWITTREYWRAKVNNPKNWYGNFQITASNVCWQIINPNSIVLGLWRKVYFTPPQYCHGVYKLCTYQNKQNYTCTCWNINFRANKAKMLNWKDWFSAQQWINKYQQFCAGKSEDTNVFANLRYPFQYGDFIWFVYNKINWYKNGSPIVYNMKNWYAKRWSVNQLIKKVYWKDYKKYLDAIFVWYLNYINSKNKVLADLSAPSLNFPVIIDWKQYDYQKVLISMANDLKISPSMLGNLLNSYQLGIIYSKYNGLWNAWYNFFDNSYVSNVSKKWWEDMGLKIYYYFGKITKDYCTTCIWKDQQAYWAMIFANIYQQKNTFLQYLLMDLFPNMVRKWLFKKLLDYKLF